MAELADEIDVPGYRPVRFIGKGFFSRGVYLMHHQALAVDRAVKLIDCRTIHQLDTFHEEARLLRDLTHENIVRVWDAGSCSFWDGVAHRPHIFIGMEFLPNGSLAGLSGQNPMPLSQALSLTSDVTYGLEFAHDQGVIHRDIKPGNILVSESGRAKLSDFGLALRTESVAPTGSGYLPHRAPEMILTNTASVQSDIFALGLTLYRVINGDSFLPSFRLVQTANGTN